MTTTNQSNAMTPEAQRIATIEEAREFLSAAIGEQGAESAKWVAHYTDDPKGATDRAFWEGKNRAYEECLNLAQSALAQLTK